MFPNPPTITVPLHMDEHGGIRVSGTRVTFETIISTYLQGYTPETIHEFFPVVPVTDIYAIIAYYLAHREEMDAYLKHRDEEATKIRQEIEANYTPTQRASQERLRKLAAEKRLERGE